MVADKMNPKRNGDGLTFVQRFISSYPVHSHQLLYRICCPLLVRDESTSILCGMLSAFSSKAGKFVWLYAERAPFSFLRRRRAKPTLTAFEREGGCSVVAHRKRSFCAFTAIDPRRFKSTAQSHFENGTAQNVNKQITSTRFRPFIVPLLELH